MQTFSPADIVGEKWLSGYLPVWQMPESMFVIS
jgi:hypothetical protein